MLTPAFWLSIYASLIIISMLAAMYLLDMKHYRTNIRIILAKYRELKERLKSSEAQSKSLADKLSSAFAASTQPAPNPTESADADDDLSAEVNQEAVAQREVVKATKNEIAESSASAESKVVNAKTKTDDRDIHEAFNEQKKVIDKQDRLIRELEMCLSIAESDSEALRQKLDLAAKRLKQEVAKSRILTATPQQAKALTR